MRRRHADQLRALWLAGRREVVVHQLDSHTTELSWTEPDGSRHHAYAPTRMGSRTLIDRGRALTAIRDHLGAGRNPGPP